jgi:hypothetical protein
MATNLAIDQDLLEEAQVLAGHKTKRETVNRALEEYVRLFKRKGILYYFNRVPMLKGFDYKKLRSRKLF